MSRGEDARRVLSGLLMVAGKVLEESQLLGRLVRSDLAAGRPHSGWVSSLQHKAPPPVSSVPEPSALLKQQHELAATVAAAAPAVSTVYAQEPAATAVATAPAPGKASHASAVLAEEPVSSAASASVVRLAEPEVASSSERHAVLEPEEHGLQGVTFVKPDSDAAAPSSSSSGSSEAATSGAVAAAAAAAAAAQPPPPAATSTSSPQPDGRKFTPRERAVPSTSIGRAVGFAGLGASLLWGTVQESVSRTFRGSSASSASSQDGKGSHPSSAWISEQNAERLANALCRMRGAALKLGQMLSIQDENVLPPQFSAALERVRAGADIMPRRQLEKVLVSELGADWRSQLADFDYTPMAAASIGQVHGATLLDGRSVCMKIQYPGVKESINSDVDNLMRLISVANVLPKGLYVENAVNVAKKELALECDYRYEAQAQQRFKQLVESDPRTAARFRVPAVVPELSSERVLTSERVQGVHIDRVAQMAQDVRDAVGTRLLALTLQELFEWRYMQTDPNWGNFIYDAQSDTINLIDFGAAKGYPPAFVSDYLQMVKACAERDRDEVIERSMRLGFLTGDESRVMLDAHVEAGTMVGVPFSTPGLYDFGSHGGITRRVTELGSVMLRHRLTPPPDESYSLHRKLSGAFLACIKLKARVPCRELFYDTYARALPAGSAGAGADVEDARASVA